MYCINCGKEINDSAKFCPYCGEATLSVAASGTGAVPDSTPVQEQDGVANAARQSVSVPLNPVSPPKKRCNKAPVIVIVVVIAVLAAVIIPNKINRPFNDDSAESYEAAESEYDSGNDGEANTDAASTHTDEIVVEDEASIVVDVDADEENGSAAASGLLTSDVTVGDVVEFGPYEWQVLAVENNRALIITKDVVEKRAYNEELTDVTWETCTLRSYLNGAFCDQFSAEEKARIIDTELANDDSVEWNTEGGNNTTDKVFLLSLDEVDKYFKDDASRAATLNGEAWWWWLRSPGYGSDFAADVYYDGGVYDYGIYVYYVPYGVRPALYLNLES